MSMLDNHKILFSNAALFFVGLTIMVAVIPALSNQERNRPLPGAPALSREARIGKGIYIANGCVACHTQQVRNIDMDRIWGDRPGLAADYAANVRTDFWRNTATLMGTERTGPDLTNVGVRQPGKDWNLVHLFNPRIVVKESVMPAYPWLFERKKDPGKSDVIVNVPAAYLNGDEKVVATKDALYLLAYLQSLKQAALPQNTVSPEFLYKKELKKAAGGEAPAADGKALYAANCQTCHQENGEGLPGAFPPLKGSPVVTGDDLEKYVGIIMDGYDARAEYGVMPAVGTNMSFTENEVAAIINHERSSWGNQGKKVTPEEVKKIIDLLKLKTP
ncbi:cbb3-type cytochrome c oxidase subunit II [Niabella drilacis]|uniref:Cytochrome c oxidase cbb3-type subunit 2 n=1 Tax=Niabella drilacis (strain DSM 25811 / CCM 8410 / CCUG 62505 / LMG 26954 / E90) TaxID=1285928 RepID=A0A1G6T4B7_NIADE|nr:cbb3-type cytochrome c oxidase subunit II [Niabella drilacis]SDD23734.1 cytochrome c oxidase cbb3-type subunit 2 [Niabella drilacis]